MKAGQIYSASDAQKTNEYYSVLFSKGALGELAVYLLRAQKNSARAKEYRGGVLGQGKFSNMAYRRKDYSLEKICSLLKDYAGDLKIRYGWKPDPTVPLRGQMSWVLYVDLPTGQVSFHSADRYEGPAYEGIWDGKFESPRRIHKFCDAVNDGTITNGTAIEMMVSANARPCKCAEVGYRNNADGTTDKKLLAKSTCPICHGTALVVPCRICSATGMIPGSEICSECSGSGRIPA
jgi:hypothetical protein